MILTKSSISIILAFVFFPLAAVLASESDGTILAGHEYAWCNNSGWVNFGLILGDIHVTDTNLAGYAWAADHGWINLNPPLGGVQNDGAGNLSGSAWGEQLGWVSFKNVAIDSQGRFSGAATGTLAGTLTFDCPYCSVQTDWRPASARGVCGNGNIDSGEQCDGGNLGGQTCTGLGYSSGSLSCRADCTLNTSGCSSGGGGGGGGGGGHRAQPLTNSVIFSGRAYPKSTITLLKDAQIAATAPAGTDANFQITLAGLSAGDYIFSLYSEDSRSSRSSVLNFPVKITAGVTVNITGIFISPTIAVDKSEVARGDNIAIFGQSAPRADILIAVNSEQEFFAKVASDQNGVYLENFDTSVLDYDTHLAKSRASINNSQEVSGFSQSVNFKVGAKTALSPSQKCPLKADLNDDCRVNLIDFSIFLYWFNQPLNPSIKKLELEKFNGDGKIDLTDFSVMAFYWTG